MDPQAKLKNLNESLKKIQHEMNPSLLEPSHLEWDSFLNKITDISELYQGLISQLSPELKNYVTYPTKFDSYESSLPPGNLLSLDKTNPIVQQREQIQENYAHFLEENDLQYADVNTKTQRVMADINQHNNACKQALEKITNFISANRLAEKLDEISRPSNEFANKLSMFEFMDSI